MDATPSLWGKNFLGTQDQIDKPLSGRIRWFAWLPTFRLGHGGGTGINTHPEFGAKVAQRLTEALGFLLPRPTIILKPKPPGIVWSKPPAFAYGRGLVHQDCQRPALDGIWPTRGVV